MPTKTSNKAVKKASKTPATLEQKLMRIHDAKREALRIHDTLLTEAIIYGDLNDIYDHNTSEGMNFARLVKRFLDLMQERSA